MILFNDPCTEQEDQLSLNHNPIGLHMDQTFLNVSNPDHELVNELNRGNIKAFDLIFKKYYDSLCRFAFSMLHDADLSQSLMNQAVSLFLLFFSFQSMKTTKKYYFYFCNNGIICGRRRKITGAVVHSGR